MKIDVLPIELYVEKFHERPRPGRSYEVEGGIVYRTRQGEAEDIGELPESLAAVSLSPLDFAGGWFIGEPVTIGRLRGIAEKLSALKLEMESVLRT